MIKPNITGKMIDGNCIIFKIIMWVNKRTIEEFISVKESENRNLCIFLQWHEWEEKVVSKEVDFSFGKYMCWSR